MHANHYALEIEINTIDCDFVFLISFRFSLSFLPFCRYYRDVIFTSISIKNVTNFDRLVQKIMVTGARNETKTYFD